MSTREGIRFIHESAHANQPKSPQDLGIPQPPLEIAPDPSHMRVDLPKPEALNIPGIDLTKAIVQRRTLRKYRQDPLTLEELAYLLWCSQGVKDVTDRPVTLRTVPSAGARHPFETFIVVRNVIGLAPGLYRYLAIEHALELVRTGNGIASEVSSACLSQTQVRDCPVSFWWMVVTERTTWRYTTRAYRYFFIDAGHVCQNLTLAAEAIDAGVCAIGAYDDGMLNAFFEIDGESKFICYGATLGKKPTR